jgi:phenylpropionate dioxygenase-like ring-hydroxylating dioxygenase large terminal subunit
MEEVAVARYAKPAEGSWTTHYGLGTTDVSYEDSISREFYELEREAVFKRAWLNVGRTDLLPRNGSYFTKELAVANTSIIVVRGLDGEVRAFHNICRHRGNKLVWQDYPREECSGNARQFVCKYHGWKYDLDGACAFVQQESEFFDLDKADYGLVPVHCDLWEGFIFVNLDQEPRQTLREFLGPMVLGLEGYPFDKLTDRWFYRAEIKSNWKIFSDATQEFYHAPVLHAGQAPAAFSVPAREAGFEAPYYRIDGPHRLVTTGGIRPWDMQPEQYRPIEGITKAGLFGPWDPYDIGDTPPGLNPGNAPIWGNQSYQLWPNWVLLFWTQGFYYIYHYWPTGHDSMIYESTLYFPPATKPSERVQQEVIALAFKDFGLQDVNTCESTQQMLESRAVQLFPLGDQEVLCRHMHTVVVAAVDDYKREMGL